MADDAYVIASRDAITESYELGSTSPITNPFYYDGHLNFGYGYNITVNGSDPVVSALGGVNTATYIQQALDGIDAGNEVSAVATLNSYFNNGTDYRPQAVSVLDSFYYTNVIPILESKISNYDSIGDNEKIGLSDMAYNGPGTIGPKLTADVTSGSVGCRGL